MLSSKREERFKVAFPGKGELLCSCIVVLIRIVKDFGVGLYIMITWDFVMKTTLFFGWSRYFRGLPAQLKCIHYRFEPRMSEECSRSNTGRSPVYVEHFLKN